MEKNPKMKPKK